MSQKDEFYEITAEVQQLLMQRDFSGAEYAIRQFCEKRDSQLKSQITLLRSQLSSALESANRHSRYNDDDLPYPEEYRE